MLRRVPKKLLLPLLSIVLACCICFKALANPEWANAFTKMSSDERCHFINTYPYWKVGNNRAQLLSLVNDMIRLSNEAKDGRAVLAAQFQFCFQRGLDEGPLPNGSKDTYVLMRYLEKTARENNYPIEEIVVLFHILGHPYNPDYSNYQQKYIDYQNLFERMKSVGFEKFSDYHIENLLLNMAMFMWDMEDFDKALGYLTAAERIVVQKKENEYAYTQVMSYMQSYWKRKKEYEKSLGYAYKIKNFHEHFIPTNKEEKWRNDFWKGFADIEIADLLLKEGKPEQSEIFADRGYLQSRASAGDVDEVSNSLAEYDALQVLIDIKLQLGKLQQANQLLQRAIQLKQLLEAKEKFDYFKPIKLYQYLARYYERMGNPATALAYTHQAQELTDSLNIKNDAHKLAMAQQKFDIEKYMHKIAAVEKEKRLEKKLKNAAVVILVLVLALVFIYNKNVQANKKQKQIELNRAVGRLDELTQNIREKSEQADNLRIENEKLHARGQKSEYMEQLYKSTILTDEDWTNFKSIFEKVYPDFIAEQKIQYPSITPAEIRLLVLEKLGLNAHEMANTLGVNKNTIHQTRLRLRKKIETVVV